MSHVRCFAHSLVSAVALLSWAGAAYIGIWHGSAGDEFRFLGLTLLILAGTMTVLAGAPVVFFAFLKRHTDLLSSMTALQAVWNYGCAEGVKRERRRHEATCEYRPLRAVRR